MPKKSRHLKKKSAISKKKEVGTGSVRPKSTAAKKKAVKKKIIKKKIIKKKAVKKKIVKKKIVKKKIVKKKAASATKSKAKTASAIKSLAQPTENRQLKKTLKKAPKSKKASSKVDKKSPKPASGPSPTAYLDPLLEREPLTLEQLQQVETGLNAEDLTMFRNLLLEKRAEIVGDVNQMEQARNDNSGGNLSHMPLHMADIGSDNYEQEFTLGLMESEKRLVREIDQALLRIREGTYGVCLKSGKPIRRERLEIKPWATYSIEVARERERHGWALG